MPAEHGLWSYCVVDAGTAPPAGIAGVDPSHTVRPIEHGGLALLASTVPLAEYGEGALRENLNDFAWLERVARAHEAVLERVQEHATIVPLRLCTIFGDEEGARRMLDERREPLATALEVLAGHQEWAVKLLVDRAALEAAAGGPSDEEQPAGAGGGAAYMLRRRQERETREAARGLAAALADDVHTRLRECARAAVVNPAQNRELSGHEGDMLLNGAYLVEASAVGALRELVAELQERHRELGARLELSGPLPPYNFAGGVPA